LEKKPRRARFGVQISVSQPTAHAASPMATAMRNGVSVQVRSDIGATLDHFVVPVETG
jgi:hypothetical protein